jgi:aryl-alcohol dehydrogenase-like predicted oxidoreductase
MQYTKLGRTGLMVSRLCLGTFNFYHVTSEAEAFELLDKAESLGINFIDTANIYGKENSARGAAEALIGDWLQRSKSRRSSLVLSTKVYGPMGTGPNQKGLSAYHIRQACEDSLRRLKSDHIDIYQMHRFDSNTPLDEIWQAMDILIQQGKVLYIGSSNFAAWQIAKAQYSAEKKNLLGLVCEQSIYNLMERSVEAEVLPAVRDIGMGFLPWSPLAGGLLTGVFQKIQSGRRALPHKQQEIRQHRKALQEYEHICTDLDAKPAHIALAWLLHNPAVTAPIIGARNAAQLEDSVNALDIRLDNDQLEQLNNLWPGPGEAPDAYTRWGSPR